MSQITITSMMVGPIQTNCYLVMDEITKHALVFDPGEEAERIEQYLNNNSMIVDAIFITHGHFDHITGASKLKELTKAPIYIGVKDKEIAMDPMRNCSQFFGSNTELTADHVVQDQDRLSFLDTTITVYETPGHTIGSVCYYFEQEKILISGDTLFYGSYGRTDFPTGSEKAIMSSLHRLLDVLPDDVTVYPGHGCKTSIGYEKKYNPAGNGA